MSHSLQVHLSEQPAFTGQLFSVMVALCMAMKGDRHCCQLTHDATWQRFKAREDYQRQPGKLTFTVLTRHVQMACMMHTWRWTLKVELLTCCTAAQSQRTNKQKFHVAMLTAWCEGQNFTSAPTFKLQKSHQVPCRRARQDCIHEEWYPWELTHAVQEGK